MIVLYCEECNNAITKEDGGLKYNGLYFCSEECLNGYISWYIESIPEDDFERNGVETKPDEQDEEDETVND